MIFLQWFKNGLIAKAEQLEDDAVFAEGYYPKGTSGRAIGELNAAFSRMWAQVFLAIAEYF